MEENHGSTKSLLLLYEQETDKLEIFFEPVNFINNGLPTDDFIFYRFTAGWKNIHNCYFKKLDSIEILDSSSYELCLRNLLRKRKSLLSIFIQRVRSDSPNQFAKLKIMLENFLKSHDFILEKILSAEKQKLRNEMKISQKTHQVIRAYAESARLGLPNLGS